MVAPPRSALRRRPPAVAADGLQNGPSGFQGVFERGSLGQLIVDFPTRRIDAVNAAFCAMTGFSTRDLVGNDVALIFPGGRSPATDIEDRLAEGSTHGYSVERLLQRRDGSILPVLETVSAVRTEDGTPMQLLVLVQDLTEQRVAEEVQRRSQAVLDAAIATLPVTFTSFDIHLRCTYVGGGLGRAGSTPENFVGKHVSEILDDQPTLRALQDALAGAGSTTRASYNGQTYMTVHAPMRDDDGGVVGVISVSTNVTAEVTAEADRRQAEETRLFVAQHDPLTGLLGRSALVEHLNELVAAGRPAGALLLLDLDEFNLVNDSLGHVVGDAVLLEVASRVSDAFPGLTVARHGGDEFAVVAPFVVDWAEAVEAAARVETLLGAVVQVGKHAVRVTASVGIALERGRGSATMLIRNTDSALAHAKQAGTGQYRVYDARMRLQVQDRLGIQDGLRLAQGAGQLHLAYQPIVCLADRRTIASEALLRWTHPERGCVAPADFIPVAERTGLIVSIGQWVMGTACAALLPVHRDHGTSVSVNVSVRQLIGGGFAEWVEKILSRTGLPPCALTVEVTESALMDDIGSVRTAFHRLRSRGVRVAVDDFGTGYSSLARLQHLPVDVIKLDRAFVADVDVRKGARSMASAILQLSIAIGADIVAEGIETEAEAAVLLDLGYTAGQGYLFARPMPIEGLAARLRSEEPEPGASTASVVQRTDITQKI